MGDKPKEPDTQTIELTPAQMEQAKKEFLQRKKYAEENKEHLRELRKKWKATHVEQRRALEKKYDDAHREERRVASREYYYAHREELLQKQKERRERQKTGPPDEPGKTVPG